MADTGCLIIRAAVRQNSGNFLLYVERIAIGDLAPDTTWQQALYDVDMVIYLAARVHVMRDSAVDPVAEFYRVNVVGTPGFA